MLYVLQRIQIMKTPIICGREPTSSEEEKKLAAERSSELSATVNQVILVEESFLRIILTFSLVLSITK